MKQAVLDLVGSYENRISMVEELTTTAYQATVACDESLAELEKERERLKTSLRETLVKNCSLRRRDFNSLMERALADYRGKRKEIEEERNRVREKLMEYLHEQKGLAASVRQRLVEFAQETKHSDDLEATIGDLKAVHQDRGEEVFALLRNFRFDLELFQNEQEEINRRLKRLLDRRESLRVEDLKQLEAAKARQYRKAERELRREDVERLLAHFKQQRQSNIRHWR
jgi:hypothetical protein